MAEQLLGNTGSILILTMIAMTLMSTGSGEVMAVSSIIVYDIYQIYINPFWFETNPPKRCPFYLFYFAEKEGSFL